MLHRSLIPVFAALALLLAAGCGKKDVEIPMTGAFGPYNYILEAYYPISAISLSEVSGEKGLLLHIDAEPEVTEEKDLDKYLIYAYRFGDHWRKDFKHVGPRAEALEPISRLELLRKLPDGTLQDVSAEIEVEYQVAQWLFLKVEQYLGVSRESFGESIDDWEYGQQFHGYLPLRYSNPLYRYGWDGMGYRQRASLLRLEQLRCIYPIIFIPNPEGWELVVRLIRPDGSLLEASL